MARSKEAHIIMIVITVLVAVSWAGGAWPASEVGDGNHAAVAAGRAPDWNDPDD